jgi:hypothetical protein
VASSNGQDGANTGYAGGGTGGSILIETYLFDGSGYFFLWSEEKYILEVKYNYKKNLIPY